MTNRRLARFAFIVGLLAAMGACASRTPPAVVPSPQPAPQSPAPPSVPAPIPEPPAPPPAPEPAPERRPEDDSTACALISEPGEPIATVALGERVDPKHAPYPSNESERLLFRQLYETLVRVDCNGRAVPGLASSWRLSIDGRTWIAALRAGARFSDGTPVSAADVLAGWSSDGVGGDLHPHVSRLVESVIAIDNSTVAITPRSRRVDAPVVLAHTDLAIARPIAGSPWPLGTRSNRVETDRNAVIVSTGDNGMRVRFLMTRGDPRDLLDEAVDLLVTRDRAALDYAATLSQFQSVPLAWQRTEVLLTPGRARTSPSLSAEARQALAADAIRGEARGAMGPFWWQALPDCDLAAVQPRDQTPGGRIVYDADDSAARDLAERFVGLARASGSGASPILDALLPDRTRRANQRAVGLTGDALALARRRGTDAGYVVSLEGRPLDPCRELQVLTDDARWLDPETIVPLVDTRLRALVRRGRSGVTAEWDGGLLIAGAGDQSKE